MALFELVIGLLFVGALLAAWARRMNAPFPALLALGGAALAFLPNTPRVALDPQLVLALFVAPVLLDAAYDASPRDLKQNWRAVAGLALGAVGLTVVAVALVVRALMPAMPWFAAIALGAIVAPTDAAAVTPVLRQLRPPHRVLVILGGESLFNDASALLVYRLAVGAAVTGAISGWAAAPMLLLVSTGSVVLGAALSRISLATLGRIRDVATAVVVQFLSTFAVWLIAERLHLSGILAVVAYAILVARKAPDQTPARLRIPSYAVWDVVVFVLNVLAFILVGLQLKPILEQLDRPQLAAHGAIAAAVTATLIATRFLWVMSYTAASRLIARGDRGHRIARIPSFRSAALIAWCGMRGIVTLAAALALPFGFPHRDVILFIASWVVIGTLVVQGLTVGPLLKALRMKDDGVVDREVRLARVETARAALAAVDSAGDSEALDPLRRKYESRLRAASPDGASAEDLSRDTHLSRAQLRAREAQRRTLSDLRARGVIGDDAFHRVEEELDWAEVNAD